MGTGASNGPLKKKDFVLPSMNKKPQPVMLATYEDYLLVSKTSDWEVFWKWWYDTTGDWSVGPARAQQRDTDEKKNDVRALEIYYQHRYKL